MSEQELDKLVGENILRLLKSKNRTTIELAEYLDVSTAAVSNWCTGKKVPRMNKIDSICKFFGVERSALLEYGVPYEPEEEKLIEIYRNLNPEGQEKLLDYGDDLMQSGKYKKISSALSGTG